MSEGPRIWGIAITWTDGVTIGSEQWQVPKEAADVLRGEMMDRDLPFAETILPIGVRDLMTSAEGVVIL